MAQNHIEQNEAPMTRGGTIQGPSRRYRRLRHPTFPADEWTANNPLLQRGELGIESDTHQIKAGDGYTLWNDLPYAGGGVTSVNSQTGDVTITAASLGALTNNATGTQALAVGDSSTASGPGGTAYGYGADAGSVAYNAVALGWGAKCSANSCVQINAISVAHTNSDANTVKIANANGNFEIMSADGTIPEARLADTTGATQGDVLTLDSTGNAVWQAGGSNYVQKTGDTMSAELRFESGVDHGAIFGYGRGIELCAIDSSDRIAPIVGAEMGTYTTSFKALVADVVLGDTSYPWKRVHAKLLNNGADITVPATGGTMVVATPPSGAGTYVLKAVVDGDGNITTQWVAE